MSNSKNELKININSLNEKKDDIEKLNTSLSSFLNGYLSENLFMESNSNSSKEFELLLKNIVRTTNLLSSILSKTSSYINIISSEFNEYDTKQADSFKGN